MSEEMRQKTFCRNRKEIPGHTDTVVPTESLEFIMNGSAEPWNDFMEECNITRLHFRHSFWQ